MKKLKKFNNFGKVNESELIKEDDQWYIDKGYISDPNIKSQEDLIKKIEAEINPAWEKFIAEFNIPMKNPKITIQDMNRGTYIRLDTDEVDDLGIFANVIKSCKFQFFSGRKVASYSKGEAFLFDPIIWSTLNVAYESIKGGSNGMDYQISKEMQSNVWYDILDGKFNNFEEQRAKEEAQKK